MAKRRGCRFLADISTAIALTHGRSSQKIDTFMVSARKSTSPFFSKLSVRHAPFATVFKQNWFSDFLFFGPRHDACNTAPETIVCFLFTSNISTSYCVSKFEFGWARSGWRRGRRVVLRFEARQPSASTFTCSTLYQYIHTSNPFQPVT